jgi:hypothetical protein
MACQICAYFATGTMPGPVDKTEVQDEETMAVFYLRKVVRCAPHNVSINEYLREKMWRGYEMQWTLYFAVTDDPAARHVMTENAHLEPIAAAAAE